MLHWKIKEKANEITMISVYLFKIRKKLIDYHENWHERHANKTIPQWDLPIS